MDIEPGRQVHIAQRGYHEIKAFGDVQIKYFPEDEARLHLIAAEIAHLIPEMARDSVVNNEALIFNKLKGQ